MPISIEYKKPSKMMVQLCSRLSCSQKSPVRSGAVVNAV
jgi:hypothetical protein